MRTRWIVRVLLVLGGCLVVLALFLRTELAGRLLCEQGRILAARLGGVDIATDRCAIEPFTMRLTVEGLRFSERGSADPVFTAKRVAVRLAPWLTLGGVPVVGEVEVESPKVSIDLSTARSDPGEASADHGCLGPLRQLRVGRLVITGGSAELQLPGGNRATVAGVDVTARRSRGDYLVEVGLSGAFAGTPRITVDGLAAKARLDVGDERLVLESATVAMPHDTVKLSGEILHLCRPELALTASARLGVESLFALAGSDLPDASGLVELTVVAEGPIASPELHGQLAMSQVRVERIEIGDLSGTWTMEDGTLAIEELTWRLEGGRARIRGTVGLAGDWPVDAEVRTEKLDFHRLLSRLGIRNTPVLMSIDSTHRLAGHLGGDGLELSGTSSIQVHGFEVRNEPWHVAGGTPIVEVPGVGRIETPVRITAAGVDLPGARVSFGPGSSIDTDVFLAFDDATGLRIHARSARLDLAHLRSHIAGLPVAGVGTVDARIAGSYGDPSISGAVGLEGARLFSAELGDVSVQVTANANTGAIDLHDIDGRFRETAYAGAVRLLLGGQASLDAELAVREGGRLGDLFQATRGLVDPLSWLHDNVTGRVVVARGRVHGPLARLAAEGQLQATGGMFMTRPYDTLGGSLALVDGERLEFSDVALARAGGVATGAGAVRFPAKGAPTVEAAIDARGLPIRELLGGFAETIDLSGEAGGRLQLSGPLDALSLSGELHADRLAAASVPLQDSRVALETQGGEVIVRGPVVGAGRLVASLRLVPGLPFQASFWLRVQDLARYLPPGMELGGELRGVLEGHGTLENLERTAGAVTLQRLVLATGDLRVESEGPVRATYEGPSFILEHLVARGENTQLSLQGTRAADGRLDLAAQGTLDARLLGTLVPEIEYVTGVIEMKAALSGTSERPTLVGSAEVREGAFRVRELPLQVQKLDGRIAFSQNRLIVEEARMVANGGAAKLSGSVGIGSWAPTELDLSAEVERASWRMPEDFPAVVSGRLQLTGAWPDRLLLAGQLDVNRLRYARELDLEAMALDFGQKVQAAPEADAVEWLHLDIDLIGGKDMRIENNLLRARLQFVAPPGMKKGQIKVVGSNVGVGLVGSVELVEGVASFRGNEYRLRQGVVGFSHRDRIDPEVDFTAETDVREYRVMVHGFGRLTGEGGSGFELELTSNPSLPRADVLTLLTFGITSRDPTVANAGAGVAAEALWRVSGLDAQVRRWLPDSEVFKDPTVNVTGQYSEVTGQLEPTASFETKILGERLKLKASTPFSTPKGRRMSAEVRVDDHVSGQILWENEETGYRAGDLGADLKLRWEWE